ncbi:MAG: hypothetical protein HZA20_04655 [Nitrospirae bacterium]|nr:hypothetical protein [Nitrospirota bacterium]
MNTNLNRFRDPMDNGLVRIPQFVDPLTLDLDGDGVETTPLAGSSAMFDLDGDDFAERTGWIGKDDGLLAMDTNNNGKIDDISELFGNKTENGFDALKKLDSNHDGKIDSNDAQFGDLRVWQDANGNGITDAGELKTLGEHNIQSLNLAYANTNTANNGNVISHVSTYTRTDGTWPLARNLQYTSKKIEQCPCLLAW